MFSIGDAKVGVSVAIEVFDEFFKELHANQVIPNSIEFTMPGDNQGSTGDTEDKSVIVELLEPRFYLRQPEMHTRLRLRCNIVFQNGSFENVIIEVVLNTVLTTNSDNNRVIALRYEGVPQGEDFIWIDGDPDGVHSIMIREMVKPGQIDTLFESGTIRDILDEVNIDLASPLIDSLGPQFFDKNVIPNADQWPVVMRFMPADSEFTMDALGVFVALPGEDADPGALDTVMINQTGFAVIYSRDFMDHALKKGAAAKKGKKLDGAKIEELEMEMLDDAIHVSGEATKDGAKITFEGPMPIHLARGTSTFVSDTSMVDVEVDMPDKYYVLWVLMPLAFFIPGLNGYLLGKLMDAGQSESSAPSKVKSGLVDAMQKELTQLAVGLSKSVNDVTLESTTEASYIEDGHIILCSQVFVSPVSSTINNGIYNRYAGRFTEFHLENGRRFKASELARLVDQGKVSTPGFHDVGGRYMRANPDNEKGNNLKEMFYPRG
jgi:hypothetical protein